MSSAGWRDIKYRQDLPPPGGYGSIPYKRNLPVRGPTGVILFGIFIAIHGLAWRLNSNKKALYDLRMEEDKQAENCYTPLLEVERDRALIRTWKDNIESEALNIVGTGFDPNFVPGIPDVFHAKRWFDPIYEGGPNFMANIRHWYEERGIPRLGP